MNKIMGLDVGDKTIGVAISDALLITAQGKTVINRTTIKEDLDQLIDYILEENIDTVVVGLPKNMNNTIGPQAEKTMSFIKKLDKKIKYTDRVSRSVKIEYWDERLTTVAAHKSMIEGDLSRKKRKKIVDKIAAIYILQGYLDRRKYGNS